MRLMNLLRRQKQTAERLGAVSLFRSCSRAQLEALDKLATELEFAAEETLAVQGRRQREVLVLLEGSAEVVRDGEVVGELGPGDLVGELEALAQAPSRATVRTTREAQALVMSDSEFRRLLGSHASLSEAVLESVARRETLAA